MQKALISDNKNELASNDNKTQASAMISNESAQKAPIHKRVNMSDAEASIEDETTKFHAGPLAKSKPMQKRQ